MSSVIACMNLGFEITGCELDDDYFNAGVERLLKHHKQAPLFTPTQVILPKQQDLLLPPPP